MNTNEFVPSDEAQIALGAIEHICEQLPHNALLAAITTYLATRYRRCDDGQFERILAMISAAMREGRMFARKFEAEGGKFDA